jgi:hypothetical protein
VSYRVLILESVKQTIASWSLSRDMVVKIYNRLLDDLANNPDQHLTERIPPLSAFAYNFILQDSHMPYKHWFLFAVDRLENNRLVVIGARHSTEDTGEN